MPRNCILKKQLYKSVGDMHLLKLLLLKIFTFCLPMYSFIYMQSKANLMQNNRQVELVCLSCLAVIF